MHTASPQPPCPIWQRIRARGMHTVAVMGMTKNTGKTVALNHLMAQAAADHVTMGQMMRAGIIFDVVGFVVVWLGLRVALPLFGWG